MLVLALFMIPLNCVQPLTDPVQLSNGFWCHKDSDTFQDGIIEFKYVITRESTHNDETYSCTFISNF